MGPPLRSSCLAPTEAARAPPFPSQGPFEFVFDNWSKDEGKAAPYASAAKAWDVSNYVFVSSAGMYTTARMPMVETDEVKESGQRKVELLLDAEGLPWTVFRPQYIYGPKTNKRDYIDYFVHRVQRDLPVPVPYKGDQRVSLTNAEDVATLLSLPLGNEKAVKQVFNCGTDEYITYDELSMLVGKTLDQAVEVFNFDPEDFDLAGQKSNVFPFRKTEFIVGVDKARSVLGFQPKHNIRDDIKWYVEDFFKLKCDQMTLDWHQDEDVSGFEEWGGTGCGCGGAGSVRRRPGSCRVLSRPDRVRCGQGSGWPSPPSTHAHTPHTHHHQIPKK